MAVFSRLLPTLASAYGLQTLFALIFVPQRNEKYYDLGGALGFLSTTFISLYYPALKDKFYYGIPGALPALSSFAPRQLLLSAALGIWSVRLGSFLAHRAIKAGGDSRFDKIKAQPMKFTYFWFAQATWISLVGLPVYLCNALPPGLHPALTVRDYAAVALFAGSFLFEVIADRQKSLWRNAKNNKQHDERFISSGLWGISRHPNYVGEVGIWTGIWALSTTTLQTAHFPRGAVALAALSPVFTWVLTRNVSGVPPLEESGDKEFGHDPRWQEYKRTVPVFWPWGPVN
ncbi:hypothetical protein D9615_005682 [Tricholomella constricta]|uniref:Steroid 5-alpha reductase C-terminal domain-containing protein n=1 Tax=Tricholomella constricta TaxID=117010 RepID=A0A8H5M3D7_9AGAR|nr:hypothetical protein D9615_005682 [Tricholomella constricta]